jgi:hypothetical protein
MDKFIKRFNSRSRKGYRVPSLKLERFTRVIVPLNLPQMKKSQQLLSNWKVKYKAPSLSYTDLLLLKILTYQQQKPRK